MTRDEILTFFAAQQQAWAARDIEALSRGYHDDAVLVSPIFRTVRGMAAIRESFRSLFQTFPDWAYTSEQLLIDGLRAADSFSVTATHAGEFMGLAGSGRRFEIQGVRLFDLRDGLIERERRYYDFTGLLIQLGVLRGKPARPETLGAV